MTVLYSVTEKALADRIFKVMRENCYKKNTDVKLVESFEGWLGRLKEIVGPNDYRYALVHLDKILQSVQIMTKLLNESVQKPRGRSDNASSVHR